MKGKSVIDKKSRNTIIAGVGIIWHFNYNQITKRA